MKTKKSVSTFTVGIDRLIPALQEPVTRLPANAPLAPTGRPGKINLDTLLGQLSAQEKALLRLVKPAVRNPFVLSPTEYQRLLDEACAHFSGMAASGHPDAARLAAGAALIEAEQQLHQLLCGQRRRFVGA